MPGRPTERASAAVRPPWASVLVRRLPAPRTMEILAVQAQIGPNLALIAQSWPNPGKIWPNWGRTGSNSVEVGPINKFEQNRNSGRIRGPISTDVRPEDQIRPKVARNRPNIDQESTTVGQQSSKVGPRCTKLAALTPNVARNLTHSAKTWLEQAQVGREFGQLWADFVQIRATLLSETMTSDVV